MRKGLMRNAVIGAVLFGLPGVAAAETYGSFGDWSVSCGNGMTCDLSTDDAQQALFGRIEFTRRSDADAPVDMVLSVPPEGLGDPAAKLSAAVDGKVLADLPVSSLTAQPDDFTVALTDDATVRRLLDAMRNGKTMVLTLEGKAGKQERTVSLTGLAASLLFLDEAQGRLKRTDALVAKGDGVPPKIAPVRAIARFDDLPAALKPIFADPDAECGGFDESNLTAAGAFAIHFDTGDDLIAMPCAPGGAYNQPFVIYVGQGDDFDLLSVPVMADAGPGIDPAPYNLDLDWPKRTLSSFFKGRGIGDCGSWYVWKLPDPDREATDIVLTEQRVKGECDGNDGGGIENWPAVWPLPPRKG